MDSLTVVYWIKGVDEVFCSHAKVVHECQEWLKRSWLVPLQFVYGEGNQVTDSLAKLVLIMQHRETKIWYSPPKNLDEVFHEDAIGTTRPRSVLTRC